MKKLFGLLILSLALFSCQDDERKDLMDQPETEKVPDSIQVLEGEFVYTADAAVVRGENFVYGVTLDSMSDMLSEKISPLKSDDFDGSGKSESQDFAESVSGRMGRSDRDSGNP